MSTIDDPIHIMSTSTTDDRNCNNDPPGARNCIVLDPSTTNLPPFGKSTIHPSLLQSRRRKRSESMTVASISVNAILVGLLLYCEATNYRPLAVDAFAISTSPRQYYAAPTSYCRRQYHHRHYHHDHRYDIVHYRRRSSRLWDSEITASDPTVRAAKISQNEPSRLASTTTNRASQPPVSGSANGNHHTPSISILKQFNLPDDLDIPRPTAKGGYTHTTASRAKISAANKGKTPWNKGKTRSVEVRARIAAGVRAKNRERLLGKLQDMGLTEETYEAQKKEERRKREAERRARKTANGGYIPTDETRAKISKALKEKHSSGQVKRRQLDPSKVRRGFTHSEETRRKISESLKKKWKNDDEYRENMLESYAKANIREETRRKISESLKKRWADPDFRDEMTKKITNRPSGRKAMTYDSSYRKKISEAMKRKWQDPSYRKKTVTSIQKSAQNRTSTTSPLLIKKKKSVPKEESIGMQMIAPLTPADFAMRKQKRLARKKMRAVQAVVATPVQPRKASTTKSKVKGTSSNSLFLVDKELDAIPQKKKAKQKRKIKTSKEKDGSVTRLKEERRDLFDLLYGDEDTLLGSDDEEDATAINGAEESTLSKMGIIFGDEDLDSFDPYGLDDY